jgi:hypothetical protein
VIMFVAQSVLQIVVPYARQQHGRTAIYKQIRPVIRDPKERVDFPQIEPEYIETGFVLFPTHVCCTPQFHENTMMNNSPNNTSSTSELDSTTLMDLHLE